jgi:hypothetical protein
MFPGGSMMWMAIGWAIALSVIATIFWTLLLLLNAFHSPGQGIATENP